MASYTLLSKKQIIEILSSYEIGLLWNFRKMPGGVANSVYFLVTTKGEYTLTVCDHKAPGEVRQRAILLNHLRDAQLLVPEIISTKKGLPFIQYKDKPVLIKTFIEGQNAYKVGNHILEELGEQLAKIHVFSVPYSLPFTIPYNSSQFLTVNNISQRFGRWIVDKTRYLQKHLPTSAPKGVIHGDLFSDNYLVYKDKIAAIIDFEEACEYYVAYDLAVCMLGNTFVKGKMDIEKTRALLKGYQKIRPLTKVERDNFHYFVTFAAVAGAYWRFKQFNLVHPDEKNKDTYQELVEIADYYEGSYASEYFKEIFLP